MLVGYEGIIVGLRKELHGRTNGGYGRFFFGKKGYEFKPSAD